MPDNLHSEGNAIGKLLFGNSQPSYLKGAQQQATLQNVLLEARQKQRQQVAAEGARDAMVASGVDPKTADLMSVMMAAKYNPRQLSGYQLDEQKLGFNDQAMTAAQDPNTDWGEFNRVLAAVAGKPVQVQRSLGTGTYTPNAFDPASDPAMTELGQAMAQHHRDTGQAALIRANKPPAQHAAKPPTAASEESTVLQEARAAIAAGAPVESVRKRLKERGYSKLAGKL